MLSPSMSRLVGIGGGKKGQQGLCDEADFVGSMLIRLLLARYENIFHSFSSTVRAHLYMSS